MSIATDTTPTIRDSRQALIDAIKAHMAREGLTRTGFGRAALGDASFLGRLGRGADVRFSTADKVLAFMGKEQWADPKQAIYRFRGADIAAYVRAREAFRAQAADGVLPIATNFRSCAPIMEYVNERFETLLSEENDQPGFQALDPFQPARAEGLSVAALDIAVADEKGKASAALQRDGEAEAVAEMCAGLIGSELIREPTGHAAARDDERAELDRERVRLWYVATTRARELLVLPRLDVAPRGTAWISLVDLALASLPALDLDDHAPEVGAGDAAAENE